MSRGGDILLGAGLVVFVGLTCQPVDDYGRSGWDGAFDTLADGRVLVRNGGQPLWPADMAPTMVEELRIGRMEGASADVFGSVRAIETDPSGRIYVLDGQAREVRVFSLDGAHLLNLGRAGEGPGEFSVPVGMSWGPAGRLWVVDGRNARYTAFDVQTGELSEERPRPLGFFVLPWPGGFDRDGRLSDVGLSREPATAGERALIRLDDRFVPIDTLLIPRFAGDEVLFVGDDGRNIASVSVPFSARLRWSFDPEGAIWVGVSDRYRIHKVGLTGDTLRTIEVARSSRPLTNQESEAATEALREAERVIGGRPESRPSIPTVRPYFDGFFTDDQGRLWVNLYRPEGEPRVADLFDHEGRYLGQIRWPQDAALGVTPVVRGDKLLLVETDENDVPTVVRYRLILPG